MSSFTEIEQAFIAKSGRSDAYPGERSPIVEVNNVYVCVYTCLSLPTYPTLLHLCTH